MKSRYLQALFPAAAVLVLDQITKIAVRESMPLWSSDEIVPGFFSLTHVLNQGAAFGFLNRSDITWQRFFFVAVTLVAVGVIGHLLKTSRDVDRTFNAGLGFILGGALGNLVDRVVFGFVTDFLDFYAGDWHWPAFNVADAAICAGAGLFILSMYQRRRPEPDGNAETPD